MLKLKEMNRSLCLLRVYASFIAGVFVNEYQTFVDCANYALWRVGSTESTILSADSENMPAKKSLCLFPATRENVLMHLFLTSFFTASQNLS